MITIFNGRGIMKDEQGGQLIYAQLDVSLREHIHLFANAKNTNALAVFLCIALHADEHGWAWPSRYTIKQETGISSEGAISAALAHLRKVKINGQRIFAHYRERRATGYWGRSAYLIFPDLPTENCTGPADKPFVTLNEYVPRKKPSQEPSFD